jgi:hypothetical protein
MLTKHRRSLFRTCRGWAIAVLQEAHAIGECEYHGWAGDRADPHAGIMPSTSPGSIRRQGYLRMPP